MRALDRARADISSGSLWKARDRLQGALKTAPANQEVLVLLGQTLFDMGDLPAAGRYWYLTTLQSDDAARAAAALADRYGQSELQMALALPVRAKLSEFPPDVQERLSALAERAKRESKVDVFGTWGPRPKPEAERGPPPGPLAKVLGALAFVLFVVVLILGVQTLIWHFVRLFT